MKKRNILLSSQTLYDMLIRRDEFALLDVREEGPYYRQHLLAASNLPAARLELDIQAKVPRRNALIVLCDENGHLAGLSATRLDALEYTNVCVLEGGIESWAKAGFSLFDGMHVPSKGFGEFISEQHLTPSVSADDLHQMLDGDTAPFLIDCRPEKEYQAWSLPGAIDMPGVELAYRFEQLDIPQEQQIVVNCAGRTRSIMATQTLIDLGLGDKVTGLKNGLMGWRLAGYEKQTADPFAGRQDNKKVNTLPTVTPQSIAAIEQRVNQLADQFNIPILDAAEYNRLRSSWQQRTVYLVDVRTPQEYALAHHAEAISAPGGQLVQETDRHIGVRNAVIILTDDTGIRARLTASWLKRMGWDDVYTFPNFPSNCCDLNGNSPLQASIHTAVASIEPEQLQGVLEDATHVVVDVSLSSNYESAHIPDAYYATRIDISQQLANLPVDRDIVLVSEDGKVAALCAQDNNDWGTRKISLLSGGMRAWQEKNLATESGMSNPLVEFDDRWWQPERHPEGTSGFMRAYLSWEVGLVERVLNDGTIHWAETCAAETDSSQI
ncbi:MAG: hypothetical protein KUG79_07155 [Pseudomonadales bacterium]|nr:hypothetical protein [Pseudomonadales bacterium]